MKYELSLFYDDAGVLVNAHRTFKDETREYLTEDELETLRSGIKQGQEWYSLHGSSEDLQP